MKNVLLIIENDILKIGVSAVGAELQQIYNKQTKLDYLWSGDPVYWGKYSPVLFPIVGTLKEDTYYYDGKSYHLPRHGFARERVFEVVEQSAASILFLLEDDATSRKIYPFAFRFFIRYRLLSDELQVQYVIENPAAGLLYFSVGGHPAFKLPIVADTEYDDYKLLFDRTENTNRWPISKEGLIETTSLPLLQHTNTLPLHQSLFEKDAIVFKNLSSTSVRLVSDKTQHGWQFNFEGFPYLGIWAAKNAPFICIEPWCGIADTVATLQQLSDKEGINCLTSDEKFERSWSFNCW